MSEENPDVNNRLRPMYFGYFFGFLVFGLFIGFAAISFCNDEYKTVTFVISYALTPFVVISMLSAFVGFVFNDHRQTRTVAAMLAGFAMGYGITTLGNIPDLLDVNLVTRENL